MKWSVSCYRAAEMEGGRQMKTIADLSAAWMSPDMFVLGHCTHTCGALSISACSH